MPFHCIVTTASLPPQHCAKAGMNSYLRERKDSFGLLPDTTDNEGGSDEVVDSAIDLIQSTRN
jgi:hypothetical protein